MDEKEATKQAFQALAIESAVRGLELTRRAARRESRRRMLFCMACGVALFYLAAETAPPLLAGVRHLTWKATLVGAALGYAFERGVFGRPVA